MLNEEDEYFRLFAACAALLAKGEDELAMRQFLAELGNPENTAWDDLETDGAWDYVLKTLQALGPKAKLAVPTIVQVLEKAPQCAETGAEALAVIGPGARDAVPTLVALLKNPELDFLAHEAIYKALASIGPGAHVALPVLQNDFEQDWKEAAGALAKIGPPGVRVLVGAIDHEDLDTRIAAASALGQAGAHANLAVPALIHALDDPRALVRAPAAESLGNLGKAAASAVPPLSEALTDEYAVVRRNAAEALGKIGKPARSAVPMLRPLLNDEYGVVREAAESALKKVAEWP
ncbi:MAG: HEAT repeat domain-containing protein [Planctomycetes bacterium]|nr:HEAT repeat domain-containing protein [Planctomycetota bacterium]